MLDQPLLKSGDAAPHIPSSPPPLHSCGPTGGFSSRLRVAASVPPNDRLTDVLLVFFLNFIFLGVSTALQTQLGAVGLELNYQPSSSKLGLAGCRKHVCFRRKKLLPPSLSCWGSFEGPPNYCFCPKTKRGNCSVAKVPPCNDKTQQ